MPTMNQNLASSASGPPVTLPPGDERVLTVLFSESGRLEDLLDVLPPMSPLASRLLMVKEGDSQSLELTRIVQSDPVLTGRILGLANSAALARSGKPVFEVIGAVLRLGADLVFAAAFAQLMALWLRSNSHLPDKSLLDALWLEYLVTAFCAREIASVLADAEVRPSHAYAAGLLHDVGTLALSCARPGPMARFAGSGYGAGTPLHEPFVKAHTQLGAALLRRWGTPAELIEVAARHHHGLSPEESAITRVVFAADHLHQRVLSHEQGDFKHAAASSLSCFGVATPQTDAALLGLGLTESIDEIAGRVAAESVRIEVLTTAVTP
jgi:putative nucleotidyltransferase with HDIG domain